MSNDEPPKKTFYEGEWITLISAPGENPVYRNRKGVTIVRTEDLLKSKKVQQDLRMLRRLREEASDADGN